MAGLKGGITAATYPGAQSEAFAYDPAGNRTSHTDIDGTTTGYNVDATGQLISDTTGTTYSYDDAGNLPGTSDGDVYVYDDYGRATSITAGGVTETYTYDARDVRATVDGITQLWDRNVLPTLISTGAGDNYVHVDGVARDGNDWLLQDAVGSVRATVDQAGVVSAETAFTAFGEPLAGNTDSFGFAGEQLDTTGLVHLRARQYNPTIGRFTTVDPVQPGAPGTTGYNLYTYAANNPTTFTDPTGQTSIQQQSATISAVALRVATGISARRAQLILFRELARQLLLRSSAGSAIIGGGVLAGGGLILGGDTPQLNPANEIDLTRPTIVTPAPATSPEPSPDPQAVGRDERTAVLPVWFGQRRLSRLTGDGNAVGAEFGARLVGPLPVFVHESGVFVSIGTRRLASAALAGAGENQVCISTNASVVEDARQRLVDIEGPLFPQTSLPSPVITVTANIRSDIPIGDPIVSRAFARFPSLPCPAGITGG